MNQTRPEHHLFALAVIVLLALWQFQIFSTTWFEDESFYGFVIENIEGVLERQPTGRVFQNRLLAPAIVSGVAALFEIDLLLAYQGFIRSSLIITNLLLYSLIWLKWQHLPSALLAVLTFSVARFLLLYRLEYPWDQLDIILFMLFAYWAFKNSSWWWLIPIYVLALFNRESVLYIALWLLLSQIWNIQFGLINWKKFTLFLFIFGLTAGAIFAIREILFLGPPNGTTFTDFDKPLIGNHWNLAHNWEKFTNLNWQSDMYLVSLTLGGCILILGWLLWNGKMPAFWSLCILATIFAFGFINETRNYLGLTSFWFVYGWPNLAQNQKPPPKTSQMEV